MNDEKLERTPRRYRLVASQPVRPSKIVLHQRGPTLAALVWMPTAAVLIAAAALYWLSARERAAVQVSVDRAAAARAASVQLVARSLGGGPQSLLVAEFVVWLDAPKAMKTGR